MTGLRFALEHPNVPSCADCKAWMWDPRTGEWTIGRNGQRVPRPSNLGTPCESCPRKSPEHEEATTLSKQNHTAYMRYLEIRAMSGACATEREKADRLHRTLMRLCDSAVRDYERSELTQSLTFVAQAAMLRG
jgi:hypothetical protein